jgi:hypothetical protein
VFEEIEEILSDKWRPGTAIFIDQQINMTLFSFVFFTNIGGDIDLERR